MKFATFASLIILLGAGSAFAADTDATTAGRPGAVLSEADCVAAWHNAAGDELTRFHRGHDSLSPVNREEGSSRTSSKPTLTTMAASPTPSFCTPASLALVTGGEADSNIAARSLY